MFLAKLREMILVANPIPYLVAGLGKDAEPVQSACGYALHLLAKHGLLVPLQSPGFSDLP